ncbi:MAG: class I SAM-dependent methyltransferase [Thermoplasmata archaeon]|nr:MAG: class I SAM-dependent methyltransferase [Thermoplasmata archaeon]
MMEEEEPKGPPEPAPEEVSKEEGPEEAPTDEAPTDDQEAEEEPEGPVSEHAGLIHDLDRLLCIYYDEQVANDLMDLVEGQDVLLVGCEDGYALSSLALAGHKVTALDFDAGHLRRCKKVLRGWHEIAYAQLEGRNFPFDDDSFDSVLLSLFAHHATNPARVFEECARVLRPGGKLVMADLVKHEETWMMDTLHDVWLGFTSDEVSGWMEKAELADIDVVDIGAKCSGPDFEEHGASVEILVMTARRP